MTEATIDIIIILAQVHGLVARSGTRLAARPGLTARDGARDADSWPVSAVSATPRARHNRHHVDENLKRGTKSTQHSRHSTVDTEQPTARQSARRSGQRDVDHATLHRDASGGGRERRTAAQINVEVIAPPAVDPNGSDDDGAAAQQLVRERDVAHHDRDGGGDADGERGGEALEDVVSVPGERGERGERRWEKKRARKQGRRGGAVGGEMEMADGQRKRQRPDRKRAGGEKEGDAMPQH